MPGAVFRFPRQVFVAALLVSLLAHLLLFASGGSFLPSMREEIDFPIEASLTPPPSTKPAPVQSPPRKAPRPPPPRPTAPAPVEPMPAVEPPPPVTEPVPAELPVVPMSESEPQPVEAAPAEAPVKPRPARRQLPGQLEIHYTVIAGEDGFVAGQAIYRWLVRDGRYSLVSTAEPTGLASFFISGRVVQVSEGLVDANGLWPEQFWMRRNERKQESARFDWRQGRLTLGEKQRVFDLPPQAQDLLSFPFHLAMTAVEGESEFNLWVTNGRRFREYGFKNLGRETVALRDRKADALHLQGGWENEGALHVWLDLAQSGLPVKVQTQDNKGKTFILLLREVKAGGG